MTIADCGEIKLGDHWNFYDNDETDDKLPPFPADWEELPENISVKKN